MTNEDRGAGGLRARGYETLGRRAPAIGVASLLAASVAWVTATQRIPQSADQAIVGLMGLHILEGRGHPVFYWGSTYGGSLEAHLVAAAFALFGSSAAAYRGVMVLLTAAVVLSIWALARAFGERKAASFTAAYLALPPFFFLYKVLTSDGHYASAVLVAAGIVASALSYHVRAGAGRSLAAPAGALGLVGGLGLWVTPLFLPVFVAAATWLGAAEARRLRLRPIVALALGFVAGSFPWWFWNARHGWASLSAPEAAGATAPRLLQNVVDLFRTALPILLGAASPHAPPPSPWLRAGALLLAAVVLALSLRRLLRGSAFDALLLWVLLVIGAASVLPARFDPLEPRFLTTGYVALAPLFGAAVCDLQRSGRLGRLAAVAFVAATAALHVQGLVSARRHLGVVPGSSSVTGPLDDLVGELRRLGVTRTWTSYWASYRISFESREEIVAAPLESDEWSRWEPHQRLVLEAADPALVLLPDRARVFEEYLKERELAPRRSVVAGFTIFTGLGPSTTDLLRRSRSLPMPRSAYRVDWIDVDVPPKVAPGSTVRLRARFRNASPWEWSLAVHLGAHIQGPGPAGPRREIPTRGSLGGWTPPGFLRESEIEIVAPSEPGVYRLEVDLVHECVDWFTTLGSAPRTVPLEVR